MRQRFGLTERQAQAILEMKLRRLTGLEEDALKAELAELKKTIEELTAILNSKRLQNSKIKSDLLDVKKRFKSPRKSEIIGEKESKKEIPFKSDETAYKEGVVVLSDSGALNRQAMRILKLFGNKDVKCVRTSVGPEQEYFLIDKAMYDKRKDLIYTGRTP